MWSATNRGVGTRKLITVSIVLDLAKTHRWNSAPVMAERGDALPGRAG
jgi:hypothetical protein